MRSLPRSLLEVGSPLDLAILRIVVPAVVLATPELRDALLFSALPPSLRIAPLGFAWIARLVPPDPHVVAIARGVLVVSAILAILGLFARASLAVAALGALYVLGVAQMYGTVTHNHHLVWLLALLSASPCADVLSLDAILRARRRGEPAPRALEAAPTPAHTLTLLFAWALLAVIFFFPGFWKLWSSGLAWITSDNLRNQMYWKWYETGVLPPLRIDRWPLACKGGALFAVLFELSFGVLIFVRRTRPVAVVAALAFHALTHVFFRIVYPSLWLCYVMFIDWRAVLGPPDPVSRPAPRRIPSTRPVLVVGALLLGGSMGFGAKGIYRAWPFACYPTFQWRVGTAIPRLRIELVFADGRVEELPLSREASPNRAQKQWGLEWSLAGVTDAPNPARLREHFRTLGPELASLARGAASVRYYRALYSVVPEQWSDPPQQQVLLAEWNLPP